MKKLLVYLFAAITLSLPACTGNNKTGGDQADSGATNVGNSGPTDSAAASSSSGSPQAVGTSGTDTSANGKGTANPTSDSIQNTPK